MRYPWLVRSLFLLAGCLAGRPAAAQVTGGAPTGSLSAHETAWLEPIYLLDNKLIISNEYLVKAIDPQAIHAIQVYKANGSTPAQWRGLATNGIISITLKQKRRLKSWTFSQLGRRLQLAQPVSYTLNGMPITDVGWHIARVAIGNIALTHNATGTVVELRTLQAPKTVYPPGTIMIRGMASR
jgi:hypothetical protein